MTIETTTQELRDACIRLSESAAMVRYHHEHYLDGVATGRSGNVQAGPRALEATPSRAASDLFGAATALTAGHPWALGSFGDRAWDSYRPALDAPLPDGLRVGTLRASGGERLPPLPAVALPAVALPAVALPAVARFARYGHLLITEGGHPGRARSLLQALTLRLAVATVPGTVRLALADPAGQGHHLSAFLRLPPPLRVGSGVAAGPAEIEVLLARLTEHVVDVTQTRLTNVYDSVEAYNEATTGARVPY